MELNQKDKGAPIEVVDSVFACKYNEPLIHQLVTAYLAGGRSGNKAQKTRSEVRGGGIKPWRQKGTGRARAGTIRSPIWRGGGVTFAAKPTSYVQKLNKKMYRTGMCSILSELVRQNRFVVVESFSIAEPKTRALVKKVNELGLTNVLIVTNEIDSNLYLAARNLHKVDVRDINGLDPVSLIGFEQVLVTVSVLKRLEEMFK